MKQTTYAILFLEVLALCTLAACTSTSTMSASVKSVKTEKPIRSDPNEQWNTYMLSADDFYRDRKYQDAEQLVLKALKEAETLGEDNTKLAKTLHVLATIYEDESKDADAEKTYQRLFPLELKRSGAYNPLVRQTGLNYASVLRRLGKDMDALLVESLVRNDDPDTCDLVLNEPVSDSSWKSMMRSGLNAMAGRHYSQATDRFRSAVKEAKKFGVQDLRVALSLKNLAAGYRREGNEYRAENLDQKAKDVYRLAGFVGVLGPEYSSFDLANVADAPKCYICDSNSLVDKIVYGRVTSDKVATGTASEKHIYYGGRVIRDERWYCEQCKQSW